MQRSRLRDVGGAVAEVSDRRSKVRDGKWRCADWVSHRKAMT